MTRKKLTYEQALEGTIKFSEKYVERGEYEFYPEKEVVKLVQEGLARNQVDEGYRYCP
jgi:ferredoxin-thioredoxin reductase catalytic subunit